MIKPLATHSTDGRAEAQMKTLWIATSTVEYHLPCLRPSNARRASQVDGAVPCDIRQRAPSAWSKLGYLHIVSPRRDRNRGLQLRNALQRFLDKSHSPGSANGLATFRGVGVFRLVNTCSMFPSSDQPALARGKEQSTA